MTERTEFLRIPSISTAHLDKQTAQMLTEKGDSNDFLICAPYEYGFFLWAAGDMDEAAPQCLKDLNAWATTRNFDWVRLDSDSGRVEEGLPTYDW